MTSILKDKKDVYPTLRKFLAKELSEDENEDDENEEGSQL
jgi:hypothetical protein